MTLKAEEFRNPWLVTYKLAYVGRDNSTMKFFLFINYICSIRKGVLNCDENTPSLFAA